MSNGFARWLICSQAAYAEPVGVLCQQAQPQQTIGVSEPIGWLVGFAESRKVRGEATVPGGGQWRDDVPIRVAPRRFAVQQQDRLRRP